MAAGMMAIMEMAMQMVKHRRVTELPMRQLTHQPGMKTQLLSHPLKIQLTQQLTQQRRRQRQRISEAARARILFVI
jgi:hypothetical protein